MPIRVPVLVSAVAFFVVVPACADDTGIIATMDEIRFRPPEEKGQAGLVEGKVGKAVRFRFEQDARSVFFTSDIHGTPEWDRAAGFSFWVKGDGADGFGGLQFIHDDDYAVRYDLCFPVEGTDWTKVTVAWRDMIPVLPGPRARPLGTPGGNVPSKLSGLWFGKWWYWNDYPALSFAIDEVRLEPTIDRDANDHRPDGPPLGRVRARLVAGKPVTIVTMGDSLTDKRHWANREVAWLDRTPEPDLVTIFFGGNDWDSGMRGEEFTRACADAVDRVRRATKGKADVMILTTIPSAAHWEATAELAEAYRAAARDRNAGLADTERAFHVAGEDDRDRLFVRDRVHLSRDGHGVVAGVVLGAIKATGSA